MRAQLTLLTYIVYFKVRKERLQLIIQALLDHCCFQFLECKSDVIFWDKG